jgi:hypothetical protein
METTKKYYFKKPLESTDFEIEKFHELVLKGGKVKEQGLKVRISNCELLAFCSVNDVIIAVSAIKRPVKSYVKKINVKAELNKDYKELKFEIGYSFTEENFRRKGINGDLKLLLLNSIKNVIGIIFSTTAIPNSQKFLENNGFVNIGIPYDGKNDRNIKYYEKSINE